MKQVIFDFVQWQHNSATIYTALDDPKLRPSSATVIRLTDGFSVLCIPDANPALAPMTMSIGPSYLYEVIEPLKYEPPPLPPKPIGISENTLLKAIAIANDPGLALELIKD